MPVQNLHNLPLLPKSYSPLAPSLLGILALFPASGRLHFLALLPGNVDFFYSLNGWLFLISQVYTKVYTSLTILCKADLLRDSLRHNSLSLYFIF
jgi:hypothetical protein